jgi:hypothetical protein
MRTSSGGTETQADEPASTMSDRGLHSRTSDSDLPTATRYSVCEPTNSGALTRPGHRFTVSGSSRLSSPRSGRHMAATRSPTENLWSTAVPTNRPYGESTTTRFPSTDETVPTTSLMAPMNFATYRVAGRL